MGGLRLPSPQEREIMRVFLMEATDMQIDGLEFDKPASGVRMVATYRDVLGHTRKKQIVSPDARNGDDIQDMVVMLSEWLTHNAASHLDSLKVH